MKGLTLLTLLLAGMAGPAPGAGFDCRKASAPIEKAICQSPELSLADDVMTESHRFLTAACNAVPGIDGLPESPEIGRRINDAVFSRLLDMPAPGKLRDGLAGLDEQFEGDGMRPLTSVEYTVICNDGRLLVVEVDGEGCGAYCESFTEQLLFDARTGRAVQPDELFADAGATTLAQRLKSGQIRRGKALIAQARKKKSLDADEGETYAWCLRQWSEFEPRLWPMAVNAKGQWRFVAGNCSAHVNRPQDLLDRLDEVMTMAQLEPHLNSYGKSLLMAIGDVRDPAPVAQQCERGDRHPLVAMLPASGPVASVAAGDEHYLLVTFVLAGWTGMNVVV